MVRIPAGESKVHEIMMDHPIKELIKNRQKGKKEGIYSICSANEYVIRAAMIRARAADSPLLIEATANQVNQFGGYTGMKPREFKDFVYGLSIKTNFPPNKIILGGDHLGPLTWKNETESEAMEKAEQLISQYVAAGFSKIHIDTSMPLGSDDKSIPLKASVIAKRGARLAKVAEAAYQNIKINDADALHPVYIVGSEVPVPGGIREDEALQVTDPDDFIESVTLFREAFMEEGIADAFEHIVAAVVQPGVEFGNDSIHDYNREAARALCRALEKYPDLVFEGHSTDYQKRAALKQMVEDGISILKVGPALTFALREGLFMLSLIEKELFHAAPEKQSYFIEILEAVMLEKPESWKPYYHGDEEDVRRSRKYGLSDRSRYYLAHPRVKAAITVLMENLLKVKIPLSLISQYLPAQYESIREGLMQNSADALLLDRIGCLLDDYIYAASG